jgi:3-deoxy-D-manno-octulosonic acid (KDO) 8-phosphate synthase
MSIVFLFDVNPDVASAGSGGAAVGGARNFIEFLFWAAVAVGLVPALIPREWR